MSELLQMIPAIALRGMTILPGKVTHVDISRQKSIKAIEEAMTTSGRIFLITQRDPVVEDPAVKDLYNIGTVARIKQIARMKQDMLRIMVEGVCRGELAYFEDEKEYLMAEVLQLPEDGERFSDNQKEAMLRNLRETFAEYLEVNKKINREAALKLEAITDLDAFMDALGNALPFPYEQKQEILEAVDLELRYEVLMSLLMKETDVQSIRNELQAKVKARVDKNQREYILREEMKVIREELGEDAQAELDHMRERTEQLEASDSVKERLKKEIDKLQNLASNGPEASVSRTFIETLLELPWDHMSEDNTDLKNAEQILDEDHYGLDKVKERILEFLAVRHMTKHGESPILCLVGPPGTGKTSIARSVARALNKEYVRICLGGVRDEAEIRGHRRTYIGAMPGRIVAGLKQAGVKNPLMLLDEIDKMSSDYKGDTASAMLEVLDSEQNNRFNDHYVDMPVDLSEVLFIATANDASSIPRPLWDRMEVIEISGYTSNEKLHIARSFLVKKQRIANGLTEEQLTVTDEGLQDLINFYTKEAGVRGLERVIGRLCRKAAREIYEGNTAQITITAQDLETYLGKKKYSVDRINEQNEVGIVRGLAWTSVGGTTLQIEVNIMPGKGACKLTGKLGDVMKESAQAGISYIRSISGEYGIEPDFFEKHDIHIHIPEGAVPKDGPSAGITMATAVLSAITGIPVYANVAMTGEISLRGRVLPIGGLKEKLLAARTAGVDTVCIPEKNEPDVEELDEEITEGLHIIPVCHMQQVLETAFVK